MDLDGSEIIESALSEYSLLIQSKSEIVNKTAHTMPIRIESSRALCVAGIRKNAPGFASSLLSYANENKDQEAWIMLFMKAI